MQTPPEFPDKILLIDKPKGITSFDVIRILRKKLGIKKMGHAGTLDPLATGLMIIGVGDGTKLLKEYIGLPKTYRTEILLGKKTTTGDLEGEVIKEKHVHEIDSNKLKKVLSEMTCTLHLPVPLYSAVKVSGVPLYKRARRGEKNLKPPIKEMTIHEVSLKDHFHEDDHFIIDLEMNVSSGTYVRSIAEEIGRQLNLPATTKEIQRTEIGPYSLKDASQL